LIRKLRKVNTIFYRLHKTLSLVWDASRNWTLAWITLLLIQGLLPAATVYLTGWLVNSLVKSVGTGIAWDKIQTVIIPAGLMAFVLLITQILGSITEWVRTAQSDLVQDHISSLVHAQSMAIDLGCYESSEYHDNLNRARSGAGGRSLALLENMGSLAQNSITLLTMAAVLLTYGIWLPLFLLFSSLPALYVVLQLNQRYHRWWRKTTIDRRWLEYYEVLLTESSFAPEMRLFKLGENFQSAYQSLRRRLRGENIKLVRDQAFGKLLAGLVTLVITAVALGVMGRQVLLGLVTLGDLALFYQAFNQGQGLMQAVLSNLGQIYKNALFIQDLFKFLDIQPQVIDPIQAIPVPAKFSKEIRFNDITFFYPGCDRAILQDFNLTIPAGKIIAIVGDNGAGKSTLIKLLCRFYDPASGSIEIDGVDIRNFSIDELRRQITVLFQSPVPFFVTAAENIAMGNLSAVSDIDEITLAAKNAGAHDSITRLPQGYDSMLGKWFPGGNDLSGGEWQRLALARSFFRRAQMIILDEPTSAMDPWAEHDWLERFRTLAKNRTAIVITHRFTLAMRADIIHVMRSGQIVESGTHNQLLAASGLYAQSWQSQMQADSSVVV
jgi:ATP-binding cassette, subfamily B, bacterial